MTYLIRDLPRDNRPRERLLAHGAEVLSDAELLAVILGTGAAGKNAIHLAEELLDGGVPGLHSRDRAALLRARGMGPAKVARIAAVLEMSRRLAAAPSGGPPPKFETDAFGAKLVRGYGHHAQERLGAALLDARHRVMKQREIFVGTVDRALVSTRDIVQYALIERAKAVVIYHNHPSGDPTPSDEDIVFTKMLRLSLAMVDLELVDHLVIGAHRFQSMRTRGEL
ncbi:MAG TPA: DNA repair protein RadC [Thermoanaerobaculia bacterium]|jgi:DNA repair protein RadC